MVVAVADSSGPTASMGVAGSPISSPPRRPAISPSVTLACIRSLGGGGVERLDHLVGDVDLRAPEHRFLKDQVVLLALEDLLDDAVGALDDGAELLVLALAQVFLELAAPALQVAVLVDELALAAHPLGLGERRRILVETVARGLEAVGEVGEVALALGELGLELGLGRLRRQ